MGSSGAVKEQQRGLKAHNKQIPRYANPFTGSQARAWTFGWNKAHGVCEGCKLCLNGTEAMPATLVQYLRDHPSNTHYATPVSAGAHAF